MTLQSALLWPRRVFDRSYAENERASPIDVSNRHPIGFCRVHGVFPATALSLWPEPPVTPLSKLLVTCPTCGRACALLPVPYQSSDDNLNILVRPSTTPEALQALIGILEASKIGKLSPAEAEIQVSEIGQSFAGTIDFWNWSSEVKAALIVVIETIIAARGAPPFDPDREDRLFEHPSRSDSGARAAGLGLLGVMIVVATFYGIVRLATALSGLSFW